MKFLTFGLALFLLTGTVGAFSVGHAFEFGSFTFEERNDGTEVVEEHSSPAFGAEYSTEITSIGLDWNAVIVEVKGVSESSCDWRVEYDGNSYSVSGDGNYPFWGVSSGNNVSVVATVKVSTGSRPASDCHIDGNIWVG